jgi:hypothetical protein
LSKRKKKRKAVRRPPKRRLSSKLRLLLKLKLTPDKGLFNLKCR